MDMRYLILIRTIILILSVICIAAGVLSGDHFDVFSQSVMICRECVGLG